MTDRTILALYQRWAVEHPKWLGTGGTLLDVFEAGYRAGQTQLLQSQCEEFQGLCQQFQQRLETQ